MKNFLVITGALVLAAGLGGCGSSGGSETNAWLGNWMEGGTQSTTCGTATETTQVSQLVVISTGPKSGTIQTNSESCPLTWDVNGDKVTLESGQSCTASVDGVNVTVDWTASSGTLSGNLITGTTGGSTTNGCSFTQQYTLTRM
jgi:hypothetical protein